VASELYVAPIKDESPLPAADLKFANQAVGFAKAIKEPLWGKRIVLARDDFQFVEIWLKRQGKRDALLYWSQAKSFFDATQALEITASPLTAYYSVLNAVKALLSSKDYPFAEAHGVSGDNPQSRRSIENEIIEIHNRGVLSALSSYLGEEEAARTHTLSDVLGNLPFIHRAFSLSRTNSPELFLSLVNPRYVRHPTDDRAWWCADVVGRDADRRVLKSMLPKYEIDEGASGRVVRRRDRIRWLPRSGASSAEKAQAIERLQAYHRKIRRDVVLISASTDLWYLKRRVASIRIVERYELTLIMAAMHRLSELARYDPKGLVKHLEGPNSWLLTEFIELAPAQFMRLIACEITGLEFRMPGVRR
jgi:hypothetical protein